MDEKDKIIALQRTKIEKLSRLNNALEQEIELLKHTKNTTTMNEFKFKKHHIVRLSNPNKFGFEESNNIFFIESINNDGIVVLNQLYHINDKGLTIFIDNIGPVKIGSDMDKHIVLDYTPMATFITPETDVEVYSFNHDDLIHPYMKGLEKFNNTEGISYLSIVKAEGFRYIHEIQNLFDNNMSLKIRLRMGII